MRKISVSCIVPYFRGERYLPGFLNNVLKQSMLSQMEIVLAHNEPTSTELETVEKFKRAHPGVINHLIVKTVEAISVSMNRCIKNANGRYVAIWNVDDLRTPNSLELQAAFLDKNSGPVLVYGDYLIVNEFGKTSGKLVSSPKFDRTEFKRSMHCGPFPMWRREIHNRVGFFDEQFRSGADFDLMVRIALNYEMGKVPGLLGYYLDEGRGLSTRKGGLQAAERTVIELRYGAYDKVDLWYVGQARKYRIYDVNNDKQWFSVGEFVPGYGQIISRPSLEIAKNAWRGLYQIPAHILRDAIKFLIRSRSV